MKVESGESFSGTFVLPAGEALALRTDLALQLAELNGRSYFDLRSAFGIREQGGLSDVQVTSEGTAVINMIGPVTRYDGFCSWMFGGVSTQALMDQISAAQSDPAVKGILLFVDSPGGQAAGIHDLAEMVRNSTKPVVAYVDALAASAAYWVASAAAEMVISPAAELGSIGVVLTLYKSREDDPRFEMVSSQSPQKRPNVMDDAGRAQIQGRLDDLADVFIGQVAQYRGVSVETVLSDFGQGNVLIGKKALAAGMADSIGDIEDALARVQGLGARAEGNPRREDLRYQISDENGEGRLGVTKEEIGALDLEALRAGNPQLAAALVGEGVRQGAVDERARILGIQKLVTPANLAVAAEQIAAAFEDGKTSAADLALVILGKQGESRAKAAEDRRADAQAIPLVADAGAREQASEAQLAKMIADAAENQSGSAGTEGAE